LELATILASVVLTGDVLVLKEIYVNAFRDENGTKIKPSPGDKNGHPGIE